MKKIIRALKSKLTMQNTGECLFVDKVNGKGVYVYKDSFGEKYMAQSKFGFRVKMGES